MFAFHPLQVEPVSWTSGFSFLFGSFFGLIAIWQYLLFSQKQETQTRKSNNPLRHYYVATTSFILGMLAIPSIVIIPVMTFILERLLPKERSFIQARKPLWPLILWCLLAIPIAILTINSQSTEAISSESSFWTRPLIAADAITFYLQKLFIPVGIGPDYGRSSVSVMGHWWVYVSWLLPASLLLYILYTRSKSRLWLGGAYFLFLTGLAPFLGIFAFEAQATSSVANRYIYLAMLGPAIALAYIVTKPKNLGIPFLGLAAVSVFCFLSTSEIANWRNDEVLWKHALLINEDSPIAHQILADKYREKKKWDLAKQHYQKVLQSNTTSPEVHFYLAEIASIQGDKTSAIPLYRKALKLKPDFALAHNALGIILLKEEKYDKALIHFLKSVEVNQSDAESLHNLGKTYVHLGKHTEAIEILRKSLKVKNQRSNSKRSETQALLGQSLSATGQMEMGQIHLETALKLDPDHAVANKILADLYYTQENYDGALEHYKKAIKTYKNNEKILYNLGIIMSKRQNYKKAQGYFEEAITINPESVDTLTNLAIADFHLKDFQSATEHFEKALKINPDVADAYYYLGDIARWKGKKEESLALYYRTLKISKNHSQAHYRLGNYFMRNDKVRQAIRHYRSALKQEPDNKRVMANLKRAERALESGAM
ncbi:MAG: tetratricopeptide repeat protein [Bdellovibrionota bacterium]